MKPKTKYHNKKVSFQGIEFDSKKERDFYIYLLSQQQHGEISNLRIQVHYELLPAIYKSTVIHLKTKDKTVSTLVQRKVEYVADFVYTDKDGTERVIDTKGFRTKEYQLKKKMMRSLLNIEIIEK